MKLSQAKSSDPVQQKLRDDKSALNKETSGFINELIHLKKTLNGTPSKNHPQRIPIGQSFPPDVASELEKLTQEFMNLSHGWKDIIEEQDHYSKNRKHKVAFVSEGSNRLTRFISKWRGPMLFDSKEQMENKYRISMLNQVEGIYALAKELQMEAVGDDNFQAIQKIYERIEMELQKVFVTGGNWGSGSPRDKSVSEPPPGDTDSHPTPGAGSGEPPAPEKAKSPPKDKLSIEDVMSLSKQQKQALAKGWYNDLISYDAGEKFKEDFTGFFNLCKGIMGDDENPKHFTAAYRKYNSVLNAAKAHHNMPDAKSLKEIKDSLPSLEKNASNIVSRWINKMKHKLNQNDPTSAARLALFNYCDEMKVGLDKIMDGLESPGISGQDVQDLMLKLKDVSNSLYKFIYPLGSSSPEHMERLRTTIERRRVREQSKGFI
jgi:ribosome-associated translation inhibitor RaiA